MLRISNVMPFTYLNIPELPDDKHDGNADKIDHEPPHSHVDAVVELHVRGFPHFFGAESAAVKHTLASD